MEHRSSSTSRSSYKTEMVDRSKLTVMRFDTLLVNAGSPNKLRKKKRSIPRRVLEAEISIQLNFALLKAKAGLICMMKRSSLKIALWHNPSLHVYSSLRLTCEDENCVAFIKSVLVYSCQLSFDCP